MTKNFEMKENITKNEDKIKKSVDNELDLEIVELEDKIAPRNWNVYASL